MAEPPRVAFSVLGELAIEIDGLRQPIQRRREGLILSLLIAARAVVSADRLVSEIWADENPQNALASLQVGVSRLRAVIEPDRAPPIAHDHADVQPSPASTTSRAGCVHAICRAAPSHRQRRRSAE